MKIEGIVLNQCGQPRPYADSIYSGTVTAESEEEAKGKLASMRHVPEILPKQDSVRWSCPYFRSWRKINETTWGFVIVEEYTG